LFAALDNILIISDNINPRITFLGNTLVISDPNLILKYSNYFNDYYDDNDLDESDWNYPN